MVGKKYKMKLTPETNASSDNSVLIQKTVKNSLAAMSVAIIFLSSAALWTVIQLMQLYNKADVIDEQLHDIHSMQASVNERTLLMYAMGTGDEPFQIDEQRMAFYSAGAKFALARAELYKSELADNERKLVIALEAIPKVNGQRQDEVIELVIYGKNELALKLLREKIIPDKKKVLQSLDKIEASIEKRNNAIKLKVESTENTSVIILLSLIVIIIFSVLYIIRQTTHRLNDIISDLSETRLSLQNTILELIQQKDTLDHHAIVSIADEFGSITYVNDKFCEISGYSRDELIGNNHRMLKSDMHAPEFYQDLWNTIKEGNVWHGKVCNHRKDGSNYWVESSISPFLDTSGKPYQYVSIRTDITELLESKVEAEKANRAKNIFISSMSHELRTPMNAVIGFAQLLEMKLEGNELECVHEIKKSGDHLLSLLNEILDLSSLEIGTAQPLLEKIDVHTFVSESLLAIQDIAEKKNIKIHQEIEENSSIYIIADRLRLKQALLNYLTNAIKFNKDNGDVFVSIKWVGSSKCRILVKDSGMGISKDKLSTIFNPFTKLDEHIGLTEGSGIGLTITKRIVEIMNGKVGVESEEGLGSTFWIELPAD